MPRRPQRPSHSVDRRELLRLGSAALVGPRRHGAATLLILLAVASCSSGDKWSQDTGAPTDGETSTDSGSETDGGAAGDGGSAPPEIWTGVTACGSLRVLARGDARALAIELDVAVASALIAGTVLDATVAATEANLVLQDQISSGDLCGSIEEFPPGSTGEPWWQATAGTVSVHVVPDMAWGFDNPALYDGTELGTVFLSAKDLVFRPRDGASGTGASETVEVDGLEVEARLVVVDLPA